MFKDDFILEELPKAELIERARALQIVLRVIQDVALGGSVEELAARFVDAVAAYTQFPSIVVMRHVPDKHGFEIVSRRGFDELKFPDQEFQFLPAKGSLTGLAAERGSVLTTEDIANDNRVDPKVRKALTANKYSSGACVPLIYDDKLLGTFNLVYPRGKTLQESDRSMLTMLANNLAIAMAQCISKEREKHLEDQLVQSQKMEAIGTLAGGIAHDFNNILSGIIGYTELALLEVEDRPSTQQKLERVLEAGGRATELVKQILSFSRSHKSEVKPIRPAGIAQEVIKLMRAALPSTIEIKQTINSNNYVLANAINIHQVLMNLCTNAAYAMKQKGGVLSVRIQDVTLGQDDLLHRPDALPGEYLKISVEDTGTGMTKEVYEKAFDPLFTTKETGEGTGMGLVTVHGIVAELGGFVSLFSEPNQGTAVHVFIPLITEHAEIDAAPADVSLQGGTERILFIDDEQVQIDLTKDLLARYGYQVTGFPDSTIALAHFQQEPDSYDLVITDMTMPKMTGDILTQRIHLKRPDIPVIMCTGFSEVMNEQKAKALGIHAILYKPVVLKNILETIREVMNSKK